MWGISLFPHYKNIVCQNLISRDEDLVYITSSFLYPPNILTAYCLALVSFCHFLVHNVFPNTRIQKCLGFEMTVKFFSVLAFIAIILIRWLDSEVTKPPCCSSAFPNIYLQEPPDLYTQIWNLDHMAFKLCTQHILQKLTTYQIVNLWLLSIFENKKFGEFKYAKFIFNGSLQRLLLFPAFLCQ